MSSLCNQQFFCQIGRKTMNTADGVIDGTSEKFSNDGSVEWKTVLMMAREDDETFE